MVNVVTARTVENIRLIDDDDSPLPTSQSLKDAASDEEYASNGRSPKCSIT